MSRRNGDLPFRAPVTVYGPTSMLAVRGAIDLKRTEYKHWCGECLTHYAPHLFMITLRSPLITVLTFQDYLRLSNIQDGKDIGHTFFSEYQCDSKTRPQAE